MSKTLNDYVVQVQKEVDDTSNSALSVIQNSVIATVDEVMGDINEYITATITEEYPTVIGQTAYPTSEDSDYVEQVAYKPTTASNFKILYEIKDSDYRNNFINRPNSIPSNWFWNHDEPNICPKPNEVGTVRIVYRPHQGSPLITDTSLIPDRFTRVVVDGTIARFKAWENNLNAAMYYSGQYKQGSRDMILDLSTRSKKLSPKFFGLY